MTRFFKIVRLTGTVIATLFVLLFVVYMLGPKPEKPIFDAPPSENTSFRLLSDLEKSIADSENAVVDIKPECKAHIVWGDSVKKEKTKIALIYLHGFGASHKEGFPVNEDIAKRFGCNMYLARLAEHGIETGSKNENLAKFTAENYYDSAERSLQIAQQLGDSVVILAESGGAAMALFLASRHPELKGMVLYSPAVRVFRKDAQLMAGPWGLELAHLVEGPLHNWVFKKPTQAKYWTNNQRFEGIVQFTTFQKYAMIPETFAKIKCPLFMGYYYEDEEKQDNVVSVAAMKEMFNQVATPQYQKREFNFKNAKAHVITSDLTTDDWQTVETESVKFMEEVLGMMPK
jgi:pimeloyl-ACP methyl ester carboxylesterase